MVPVSQESGGGGSSQFDVMKGVKRKKKRGTRRRGGDLSQDQVRRQITAVPPLGRQPRIFNNYRLKGRGKLIVSPSLQSSGVLKLGSKVRALHDRRQGCG